MQKGVIVGSDKNQEWLIPWWWENYSKYNKLPVIFFDYGLSNEIKEFCKSNGTLLPIKDHFDVDINKTPIEYKKFWQVFNGKSCMKLARPGWFKKPAACLNSPFDLTLWVDLDCEIFGNIEPIFSYLTDESDLCIRKFVSDKDLIDRGIDVKILNLFKPEIKEGEIIYNSGVMVFRKNSPIIKNWYELCKTNNYLFHGDDEALSRIIYEKNYNTDTLPPKYHVFYEIENNKNAVILHYIGMNGKLAIIKKNLINENKSL